MQNKFDVIVIGAGNAGFAAARSAHNAGMSVAMLESDTFGGTCPNRGCTPKKVLVAAAHALEEIGLAHHHGIDVGTPQLDWSRLIQREQDLIADIPDAMSRSAASFASVYRGAARFVGPDAVEVSGEVLYGEHIVIATGSTPRPLDLPGSNLLVTSDDLLTNPTLPEDLIFIGGGVIALEFAHVFARAGSRVTIIEALPRLLPRMDTEAAAVLQKATEALGIHVVTAATVDEIARTETGLRVIYRTEEGPGCVVADKVVNGTGRVPNIANLNLCAGEVDHDGWNITLDDHFRSVSNHRVRLAGDVVPTTAQLSPLATREGREVGQSLHRTPEEDADKRNEANQHPAQPAVPQAIHTIPPLASVGLTEAEAQSQYAALTVQTSDMSSWFSSRTYAEETAWAKILIDSATDQIVGAHLVGHRGDDLIHLFTLAINHNITVADLKETIFAFPTFSSDIKNL